VHHQSTGSIIFFRYDAISDVEGRDRKSATKARKVGIGGMAKAVARRNMTWSGRGKMWQGRSRGEDGDADGATVTTAVPNDAVDDDEHDG